MYKVAFFTLGCKVNLYESNALMNEFKNKGLQVVDESMVADAYIINTCSVTNQADAKSRKMVHKAIKQNPNALICMMGCYPQTNKDALSIEGVDIIVGNGNKSSVIDKVINGIKNKQEKNVDVLDIRNVDFYDDLEVTTFSLTRAFVKIEDGCSNFCTYCIIPYARGPIRCKNHNDVINELNRICSMGYKEVVLAGIHTGRYKSEEYGLSDLIEMILNKVPLLERLRLSSIEINEIDDKLLNLMKDNRVIANHLHLPLQSGCDKILKLMNRHYDTNFFIEKIESIRKIRNDISITTDVICGFPYEDDEDFLQTVEFIKKVNFSELHVFPYSKRNGTKAALMPQVNDSVKKQRTHSLLELSKELNNKYNHRFIGQILNVIIEEAQGDYMCGHTSNYLKVYIKKEETLLKQSVDVEILEIKDGKIFGRIK